MKTTNRRFWKLAAVVGLFVNRTNWFFCIAAPAIPNGARVSLMVGTHGRCGLWFTGLSRWIQPRWIGSHKQSPANPR